MTEPNPPDAGPPATTGHRHPSQPEKEADDMPRHLFELVVCGCGWFLDPAAPHCTNGGGHR